MVSDTAGGIDERLGPEYGDYARNAASAMEFFRLPTNRVVELGSQLEI